MACADALALAVEPLVDQPRQVGGPRAENLRHRLHAAGHFGLHAQHVGDVALGLLRLQPRCRGLVRALLRLLGPGARLAHDHNQQGHQQDSKNCRRSVGGDFQR